ncbi:MAG: glycoside hydrolase family 31 protein, partial [Armatimonadota bacterium]|nr:glycoside hydrolase family 31 protein [Armatimonadota bacterium]
REYARLRYRLLPYIYSMAHVAARTAMPILRAMALAYPDDPRCDQCLNQYLFGDSFLVGAFTNTIYLPEGRWIDYWRGGVVEGPMELTCEVPEDRGGPLFVRAGAIIPTAPEMDYVGQRPWDELGLEVYPWGTSSFTLFEDDGITLAYREGAVATTEISCCASDQAVELCIEPRRGRYDGMPERRVFSVALHLPMAPQRVLVDDEPLPTGEKGWRHQSGAVLLQVAEDPAKARPRRVRCVW